jgi:prepilin-type N-terminal cleavage/methylation domain-containing protein
MAMETSPRAGGSPSHERGFTLVELVATLTIAAILAAVAGPRLLTSQQFAEGGYADEIAAALRQARSVAIASDCQVQFSIDANGYSAMQHAAAGTTCATSGAWTTPVQRGDGRTLSGWPPNSANVASPQTLVFNPDGSLFSGAAVSIVIGIAPSSHTVSVSTGGWVQRQ